MRSNIKTVFVAGHRGMVGAAIVRKLEKRSDVKLITQTRTELNLINQQVESDFFSQQTILMKYI